MFAVPFTTYQFSGVLLLHIIRGKSKSYAIMRLGKGAVSGEIPPDRAGKLCAITGSFCMRGWHLVGRDISRETTGGIGERTTGRGGLPVMQHPPLEEEDEQECDIDESRYPSIETLPYHSASHHGDHDGASSSCREIPCCSSQVIQMASTCRARDRFSRSATSRRASATQRRTRMCKTVSRVSRLIVWSHVGYAITFYHKITHFYLHYTLYFVILRVKSIEQKCDQERWDQVECGVACCGEGISDAVGGGRVRRGPIW